MVATLRTLCKSHRPTIVRTPGEGTKDCGMKQLTLATAGFERDARTTWRAVFLGEMGRPPQVKGRRYSRDHYLQCRIPPCPVALTPI